MIDIKELRIGNYVLYKDKKVRITGIVLGSDNAKDAFKEDTLLGDKNERLNRSDCSSISITDELLKSCNFQTIRNRITFRVLPRVAYELKYQPSGIMDYCYLVIVKDNNVFNHVVPADNDKDCCFIPINSLHQLQNLYFDLAGKELEIK